MYRNLLYIPPDGVAKVMDVLLDCLADENVEVREMASKVLSGVVRVSQRQSILPLKVYFFSDVALIIGPDVLLLETIRLANQENQTTF